MKVLRNHTILYDAECPMCVMYAKGLERSNILDIKTVNSYQDMPEDACILVDRQRAVNEIALINNATGEVRYGIAGLFELFAHTFPYLKPLFLFRPFVWAMNKLYFFISYNRRVITPSAVAINGIQPAFRKGYRSIYIILSLFVTAFILSSYLPLLNSLLPQKEFFKSYWGGYLICLGQLIFQSIVISLVDSKKTWNYIGNLMTLSFGGALCLLPVILLSHIAKLPGWLYGAYFVSVIVALLLEHIRRMKLLGLNPIITVSWLCYKIMVALVIFQMR